MSHVRRATSREGGDLARAVARRNETNREAARNKCIASSNKVRLILIANLVTTSKALVTRSDALVPSSVLAPSSDARSP